MPKLNRWAAHDIIEADKQAAIPPSIEVTVGLELTHRSTGTVGEVVAFTEGARVVLRDAAGQRHEFAPIDGFFEHDNQPVALRTGAVARTAAPDTRSGSRAAAPARAQVARASRIWVEGIHDAELIEKIWGDDLRAEAIVVEPLHGADDLRSAVSGFEPGPGQRLGVLLDHLVEGTKESHIAATISHPEVLITGHPYVDIWEAVKPAVIGLEAWPSVPRTRPWKEGVVQALGIQEETGRFWGGVLASIDSYADLETSLVNAVERLIDFVTGE